MCTICTSNESWKHVEFNYDTKKMKFVAIFWEKIIFWNFRLYFDKIFFSKFKLFKIFFIQPPKFIPYTNFKHQKWKLHGGFIIVPLPYWTRRASKQAASWFLPPLVFLGLTQGPQKLSSKVKTYSLFFYGNHSFNVWYLLILLS